MKTLDGLFILRWRESRVLITAETATPKLYRLSDARRVARHHNHQGLIQDHVEIVPTHIQLGDPSTTQKYAHIYEDFGIKGASRLDKLHSSKGAVGARGAVLNVAAQLRHQGEDPIPGADQIQHETTAIRGCGLGAIRMLDLRAHGRGGCRRPRPRRLRKRRSTGEAGMLPSTGPSACAPHTGDHASTRRCSQWSLGALTGLPSEARVLSCQAPPILPPTKVPHPP